MLDTLADDGKSYAYTADDSVDRDQRDRRGHLSWGSSATILEGWAGWFVDRDKSKLGQCANGADPCWPFHDGE